MPELYGRLYTRDELLRRIGRLDQVGGIEPCVFSDGLAQGVRALRVTTGTGFTFTVVPDRCLDIADAAYKGRSLCWHSAAGIVAPALCESEGVGFLRGFFGGLLTTCGLRNVGPPCEVDGEQFPMHGRVGNLPASDVSWGTDWRGDTCVLWIEGTVRESRLFGENLVLTRRIETHLGGTGLRIKTTVSNEGWRPEGHMILFHINVGFPLLDDDARLLVDPVEVRPRDDEGRKGLATYDRVVAPQPHFKEQVFVLDLRPDDIGYTTVTLVNERLDGGLALRLRFRKDQLPYMTEWRQMGEGVYVLGLEPMNCPTIEGRAEAVRRGALPVLQPGEACHYDIEVDVLSGKER